MKIIQPAHTLLSTSLLNLICGPISHQPVMWLKLLHHLMAVVNERKARAFAATILCPETEAGDLVFVGFVELGELLAEFVFGDIGAIRVENVSNMANHGVSGLSVCGDLRYLETAWDRTLRTRPSVYGRGGRYG